MVMRSIIYAAYSKDLSVKTTSAKIQMMKQGKYVGGYAPYGYVLHPSIRNKLAVDPEAADVIRPRGSGRQQHLSDRPQPE